MNDLMHHSKWHVGMRNTKTALAATLCAAVYLLIDRNPTFACIGAIFGMGTNLETSWLYGGNRLFGTIFGGIIGMVLFSIYIRFYPQAGLHPLILLLLAVGVIALILVCLICNWPGAIQPGGVMLCILLFNQPVDSYIPYSLNRILDTGVGMMVAMLVNWLLPRKQLVGWLEKLHLHKAELSE